MANRDLKAPTADIPHWRVPQVLLNAAVRSSPLLGHDLINRYRAERFQLFLTGHIALWAAAAIALPVLEYFWIFQSRWLLAFVAVGCAHCCALTVALRLARHGRYEQSITLV